MNILSLQFALFLFIILPLNRVLRPYPYYYRLFLLASCYLFYGTLEVRFLIHLILFSFSTWLSALFISSGKDRFTKQFFLILNLVIGLGGLAFYKYAELLREILFGLFSGFLSPNSAALFDIAAPLGVSFFTFLGISYSVDVYRSKTTALQNPLDVFIYVAFFPTILSGPISRAGDFIPQIDRPVFTPESYIEGFRLILTGLFKKAVISAYLWEHIVRGVFQVPESYSSTGALVGVVAYSVQIYCDFSGYSDLASGIAMLLGFKVPENFDSPYAARNLRDFWRRWHISLSTWLRDYLYIPLGGSRNGYSDKYRNLFLTMALGGLWHGASMKFIVWGIIHGAGLCVCHFWDDCRRIPGSFVSRTFPPKKHPGLVDRFIPYASTFAFVTFAWIFFGAESMDQALSIVQRALAFDLNGKGAPLTVYPVLAGVIYAQYVNIGFNEAFIRTMSRIPLPLQGGLVGLIGAIIVRLGPDGVPPFIYFQF